MKYYIQPGKGQSLRRYPIDSQVGERWDENAQQWAKHCAPKDACVLTHDQEVTEAQAKSRFPGCL